VLIIGGCSTTRTDRFLAENRRPEMAEAFFKQLDSEVKAARVEHRAYSRIEGFPYLRTSRYLAALKDQLDSPVRRKDWLLEMQALDLEAREKEIANLPESALQALTRDTPTPSADRRRELLQRTVEASGILLDHDLQSESLFPVLIDTVMVPDDYSLTMRTFGLYPLVMPVVAYFTDGAYDTMRARNQTPPADLVVHGKLMAYGPSDHTPEKASVTRRIYDGSVRDAFGLPRLSETDKLQLARLFAPIFVHDVAEAYDIPGEVTWEGNRLKIDITQPTVYYYFTPSLLHGRPILQINYVTWTAGRLGPNAPAIERGELDGITLRISLDDAGEPVMVDGMNNCGCYHFFIPRKERLLGIRPVSWDFDPVVIDYLPADFPEKPLGIRVTSGWHQVEDVGTDLTSEKLEVYRLLPYNRLESIPRNSGGFASMFDEEGVGIGSDRIEPYIFFSMGISRVGAMRQRGHHPTKLVGRAHFDDPHLLDINFELK